MNKLHSFLISFFLIISISFISVNINAGIIKKGFVAGFIYAGGWAANKMIVKALTSPKVRKKFLEATVSNPKFKEKAVKTLDKFLKNKKFKKYHEDAKILFDQVRNKIGKLAKPKKTTKEIRGSPGTAWGTKGLNKLSPANWKRAILGDGASIPMSVGKRLSGRSFKNFDDFRKAFWKELSKDKNFLKQFDKSGQSALKSGNAPFTDKILHVGKRGRYELHHIKPIEKGGSVYSMDNLVILTPKKHIELHKILGKK